MSVIGEDGVNEFPYKGVDGMTVHVLLREAFAASAFVNWVVLIA